MTDLQGFTLVEVLFAMALLAVGLFAFSGVVQTSAGTIGRSTTYSLAASIASNELERAFVACRSGAARVDSGGVTVSIASQRSGNTGSALAIIEIPRYSLVDSVSWSWPCD